jgi:hypothetical protein
LTSITRAIKLRNDDSASLGFYHRGRGEHRAVLAISQGFRPAPLCSLCPSWWNFFHRRTSITIRSSHSSINIASENSDDQTRPERFVPMPQPDFGVKSDDAQQHREESRGMARCGEKCIDKKYGMPGCSRPTEQGSADADGSHHQIENQQPFWRSSIFEAIHHE